MGGARHVTKGDKLPMDITLYTIQTGTDEPKEVTTKDLFAGKKVVVFAMPGAFTSVCSSKHLPECHQKYEDLKNAGADSVVCIAVNDPWVMREWARSSGVDSDKIFMVGDSENKFTHALGLVQRLPAVGERSLRYSMFVDDGVVKILNIEEPGPKSYKVSGPNHMLADLTQLKAEE